MNDALRSGGTLSLADRIERRRPERMKQRTNQIVFAYWNEIRAGRLAPRRLEIEPSRMAVVLPETFMLERVSAASFTYRLAGTRICESFGLELRNCEFLAGWPVSDQITIAQQMNAACEQGAALVVEFAAATGDGHYSVQFETILLPLLHAGPTVTRMLGSLSAIDPPPWLGHERLVSRQLLSHRLIWPDGRPHRVAEKHREPPPLQSALTGARLIRFDRRAFRVVEGGRSTTFRRDN